MKRVAFLAMFILALRTASASMWYVDSSVPASGDGKSWETAFQAIQQGIDAASRGDTVTVAEGIYVENIQFHGKNIVLTSTDPLEFDVVANTIIDGNQAGSVVTFDGTENDTSVLSGLTIRNGKASHGGGICGGTVESHTHATIEYNVITASSAAFPGVVYESGGGVAWCDGLLRRNVMVGNSAGYAGGALDECNGVIRENAILDNMATSSGGGLSSCRGTVEANQITRNTAYYGAGLAYCHGTVLDNAVTDNSAQMHGGGFYRCSSATVEGNLIFRNYAGSRGGGLYECQDARIGYNVIEANSAETNGGGLYKCGVVWNNVILRNTAGWKGGGLYECSDGIIHNNTIVGNSADLGGGLSYCGSAIRNCIIWDNQLGGQLVESEVPIYSCIQGLTNHGEGNIADDPRFVDLTGGDYRLLPSSPCIDAGDNSVSGLPETDMSGMHRIMFGGKSLTVDMGAYEFHMWPPSLDAPMGEVTLKWSSMAGKTYSVYRSSDMLTWELAADSLPSMGDTFTTWLDPTVPSPSPGVRIRFYRIIEEE